MVIKKLILFWDDTKKNWIFGFINLLELIICIFLMSAAFTLAFSQLKGLSVYNPSTMKNAIWANFGGVKGKEISELKSIDGFDDLATSTKILTKNVEAIIVSLAAGKYMPARSNVKFSSEISKEYAEAYVAKSLESKYAVGETYNITALFDDYARQVKILGYFDDDADLYSFEYNYENLLNQAKFYICDYLPDDATCLSGIYFNKTAEDVTYYSNQGFYASTVKQAADNLQESFKASLGNFGYIGFLILMLAVVGITAFTYIKSDLNVKRDSVKFMCGQKRREIVFSEIIKTALIYIVPFLIAIITTAVTVPEAKKLGNVAEFSWAGTLLASAITFVIFAAAVAGVIIKTIKADHLKILRNS